MTIYGPVSRSVARSVPSAQPTITTVTFILDSFIRRLNIRTAMRFDSCMFGSKASTSRQYRSGDHSPSKIKTLKSLSLSQKLRTNICLDRYADVTIGYHSHSLLSTIMTIVQVIHHNSVPQKITFRWGSEPKVSFQDLTILGIACCIR